MTLLRMLAFAPGSGNSAPGAAAGRPVPLRATPAARTEPAPRAAAPEASPIVARVAAPDAGSAPSETLASPVPIETASPEPTALPAPAARSPEPIAPPAAELVARESTPRAAWDWLAIVAELRLGGMAKMLADHCELVSQAGDAVMLRVGEAHKHLLDRTYQDKLIAALRDKYGATLAVTIEIGAAADKTPQQVRTRIKQARQAEAEAAIEQDPFVRELVDQFGGQLDATSIQPQGEST
jgi:DNA polymerase-3 subunit gamma/tau